MNDLSSIPSGPPSGFQEQVRRLARRLPLTNANRTLASILLRLAGGKHRKAYDVPVFGSQKARLYPFDNICEKRVYITPQFWDPEERHFLKTFIHTHDKDDFIFLDVGANAGLYSLFTLAVCDKADKKATIIAIEPDPLMKERMAHNIKVSGAGEQTTILPWAVTGERQEAFLHLNIKSRGMNRLDAAAKSGEDDVIKVQGHPLVDIFAERRLERIDVMKIDIEGAEYAALEAFFKTASDWQKPEMILIETSHEEPEKSALKLCIEDGYEVAMTNKKNSILLRNSLSDVA